MAPLPPVPRRNQTNNAPIRAVLCVLLCAACVLSVYFLFGREESSADSVKPSPAPTAVPTAEPSPEPTPIPVELGETEDAGQEYIDKIVFLGDSTTYWLAGYGVLPFSQIWCDAIGTLSLFNWEVDTIAYYEPGSSEDPVQLSLKDCMARRKPEILVITLGLNGIAILDESQFRDYYVNMLTALQQASPDTKIICQSIYPVDDSQVPEGISNAKVVAANGWIRDIAEQMGVRYLYSHDILMDETGNLRSDYDNGDGMGIHLDTDGLNAVLQFIRTHAWQ